MAVVHLSPVTEYLDDIGEHRMEAELALIRLREAVMSRQPEVFVDALRIAEVSLSQIGVSLSAMRQLYPRATRRPA